MGTYPRAYLIKDFEKNGVKLSQMTEGQLGDHYYFHTHESVQYNHQKNTYTRNAAIENLPDHRKKNLSL